jgi:two-component system OmpR family sensor kinase/two-component system sensor histidine kinase BaeS
MLLLSGLGMVSLISIATRGRETAVAFPTAVALGSGILLFGLLIVVVRRVGVPLGDVTEAAHRLAAGDFSTRVPVRGSRPIRMVGDAFNRMAARLEAQESQRRELMADIAHELRTPLTIVQGRLEGLLDGVYPRDDGHLNELLEEMRLLSRLVDDLRTLANAESGAVTLQKEPTDLASLSEDVVASLSAESARRQVEVRVDAPLDRTINSVDPLRLREVLMNLLSNAIRHTPAGGRVSLGISYANGRTMIAITDTGSGIAPEDLPKVFDRFYKDRRSRGSGLGLAISKSLIALHGGDIRAESAPGRGTTITVTLPSV